MRSSELDPVEILAALGVSAPTAVTSVTGGWDTALWRVEVGGTAYALRVFRAEQADTCRREARAMRAAAEAGVPVPEVHAEAICEGRPALLLSWCSGQPLLNALVARPWRVWQLGLMMGRMQARIHAVHVSEVGEPTLREWVPRAEDADAPLQARLRAVAQRSAAVLLHLDYHPLNVMTDGHQVTGVLDWANVAVGDARADLARAVTLLRLAPTPPGSPATLALGLRRVLEAAWRSGYQGLAGPFGDMAPFYAWAGAMMERDLRPKLGRPGVWLQESDLSRIHRWTVTWRRRAAD